jgi:hypothetical protein
LNKKEANECYKTAMAEIKAAGKGDITHYPEIESEYMLTFRVE